MTRLCRPWTPVEIETAVRMMLEGKTPADVSRVLSRDASAISTKMADLRRRGTTIPKCLGGRPVGSKPRRLSLGVTIRNKAKSEGYTVAEAFVLEHDRIEAREKRQAGESITEIAAFFGYDYDLIANWCQDIKPAALPMRRCMCCQADIRSEPEYYRLCREHRALATEMQGTVSHAG